jgi:DegV family protein with EDD domain
MKDFVIMTDSCCDLPLEYIESKKIPYVSLTCRISGEEYTDDFGKSLDYKMFYDSMRKGEIPKTSQPNAEAFYKVFKDIVSKDKDIIYVCVSSGLSGTYNSANIAKDMISELYKDARVAIVDVLTASLGQGLMLINAVDMKEKGAAFEEIVQYLEDTRLYLNTYITVDDLNHLRRGGRITSTAAIVGMVLHIKPVLTINNEGRVLPVLKVKGRKNVINKLAEFVFERIENPEEAVISICHGDVASEAERLKEIILGVVKVKEVLINHIGPVVGTYGGPGALAVFFIGKHRQNHIIDVNL